MAQARQAAAQTGTSTVEGTVIQLSTGVPAQDVTVLLFGAEDPSQPVKTQATGTDGTFAMSDLPAGEYTIQVTGAGFAPAWYPSAAAQPDAQPVELTTGQTVGDLTVVVGGVPATLAGTVTGEDVGGAQLTVELPLDVPPLAGEVQPEAGEATATGSTGAVVRTVPIGADGTFEVADLPSPAVYDLVVAKAGFASAVQRVDVAAGEDRSGIQLSLLTGDGSIAGSVSGAAGPVGGATVVATAGQVVVETVSLTRGPGRLVHAARAADPGLVLRRRDRGGVRPRDAQPDADARPGAHGRLGAARSGPVEHRRAGQRARAGTRAGSS